MNTALLTPHVHASPRYLNREGDGINYATVYPLASETYSIGGRLENGRTLVWVFDPERGIYPTVPVDLKCEIPKPRKRR